MAVTDIAQNEGDELGSLRDKDQTLLKAFLAEHANHRKPQTVRGKKSNIRKFVEWMHNDAPTRVEGFEDVTPGHFKLWIKHSIGQNYSASAIHHRYNSPKVFFDWIAGLPKEELAGYGLASVDTPENIAEYVTKNQRKAMNGTSRKEQTVSDFYLDASQIDSMVEQAPSDESKLRNRLFIKIMFACGLRRGEVARIKLDGIDFEERKLTFPNLKRGDNQSLMRSNWFHRDLATMLQAYINTDRGRSFNSDSPYLFPTNRAEHIHGRTVNQTVKKAAENAGVQQKHLYLDKADRPHDKVTAHTLRHSYAVYCIRSDTGGGSMDIKTLKDLMGHTNLETTQQYLKFRDELKRDAALNFGPGSG
jgi:integrase/recombinase XerD